MKASALARLADHVVGRVRRVGDATAIRRMAALTTTGTVVARPQGRARRSKLDPHEAFLRALIAERDDVTL